MIGVDKNKAIGDDHVSSSKNTPLRSDAFDLTADEKKEKIEYHFREIMNALGLDLNDDSLSGTPSRVAKMYVEELFSGLDPKNMPSASLFDNNYAYQGMLVEKDIEVTSVCEHHFVPIYGKAHVAYFANDHVIGLSKINRIVQYFGKRPQVQERLTIQIVEALKDVLKTEDVACVIDAKHMCVSMRGVQDTRSSTVTTKYSGKFQDPEVKSEFLKHISIDSKLDL